MQGQPDISPGTAAVLAEHDTPSRSVAAPAPAAPRRPTLDEMLGETGQSTEYADLTAIATGGAATARPKRPTLDDMLRGGPPGATPQALQNIANPMTVGTEALYAGGTAKVVLDNYFAHSTTGRVLDAFGQGVRHGWGTEPLGLSPETVEFLKKAGVFNDYSKGRSSLIQAFNEGLMRSAAVALDASMRVTGAGFGAFQGVAQQAFAEVGQPALGRDVAAMPEAFFGSPGSLRAPPTPQALAARASLLTEARSLGVIGEGEAGWKGVGEPAPDALAGRAEAIRDSNQTLAEDGAIAPQPAPGEMPPTPSAEAAPADIHAVARQLEPDVFREYDALEQRRDTYRRWLGDLGEAREARPDAVAAREEIDTILGRVNGVEDRLTRAQTTRLAAARDRLEQAMTTDTPDMTRVRRELQASDYRMRDLAPQVSDAYRRAQEQTPSEPVPLGEVPAEPAAAAAAAVPETQAPRPAEAIPEAGTAQPPEPAVAAPAVEPAAAAPAPTRAVPQPGGIGADVSRQLVAAGRSQPEADAAGELIAAHYTARAARFGGAKGTAEELYAREDPTVTSGSGRAQGALTLRDGVAAIRLMGKADASTFVHETGHAWLEELARDARSEGAPPQLAADMAAVRRWLGGEEGPITRGQHEKFARGFERYMMEGRAPSAALAQVFAQFKAWLTAIYQTVNRLRSPISDDIRAVFDRMLAAPEHEPIIAPDRAAGFADHHEVLAEHAPPEMAGTLADRVRAEADAAAAERGPDVHAELTGNLARPGTETGGGAGEGVQPDRNGVAPGQRPGDAGIGERVGALSEGRGEVAAEGAGPSPQRPAAQPAGGRLSALEKVPRPPLRLSSFLHREGGIQDQGGEISHILGGKRFRPGFINKNGMTLDDAAQRAWEEGYLGDRAERPDINALLDALGDDLRGRPVFSSRDEAAVASYHETLARNAEVDRLSQETGVSTEGKTREQFFDEVAGKMSLERAAADAESMAAAHEDALAEADRRAQEWRDERGDAWEPDALPENGERSLEDMERAYREEEAARWTGSRADDVGGRGTAPGDQGALQAGSGPGERGAGAGRGGDEAGGPTGTDANVILPRGDTRLVDKAGNIRLDNLNQPEDVNAAIRQAAEDEHGFITERRGVISDAEVLNLADALGMDPAKLNGRRIGDAFNAEQIIAARKLLVQSAALVRDAMAKAAAGTDADLLAYAEARSRHLMIQGQVAGITAEAGRALRAFHSIEGGADAKALGELLELSTGRTLYQLRREVQLGLDLDTPQKISRFLQDQEKPGWKDWTLEAWINALLSGPITHVKNIIGNGAVAVNSVAETTVAAGIGSARAALGMSAVDRVYFSEVRARVFGIVQGAQEGLIAAGRSLADETLNERESHTIEQRRYQAIPSFKVNVAGHEVEIGGKQVRLPGRLLTAEDEFFKAVATRQELNAIAARTADMEGLEGGEWNARVAQLLQDPPEAMLEQARKHALYQTFTNPLGTAGRAIQQFANSHFLAKIIIPFIRTPLNIVKYAGERTPFGLLSSEIRDNLAGRNGAAVRDTQVARMALGSMLATTTAYFAAQGLITGGGPSDPHEKAAMRLTGWQPYSIKIGDMYYSYAWLDPQSSIMGLSADMVEAAKRGLGEEGELDKAGAMMVASISKNIMEKASLRGASEFIQLLTDPDRYGPRYFQNLAGTVAPSVLAQFARTDDPTLREVRGFVDSLKSRIPGMRADLFPKRNVWGEPIVREGALGPDLLSPIYESSLNDDPVNAALMRAKVFPSAPDREIRGVKLTDQQYDDYSRIAGRMAKQRLNMLVGGASFGSLPLGVQHKLVSEAISNSRNVAHNIVMMQNPSIIQQSVSDKKAFLDTGTKPKH